MPGVLGCKFAGDCYCDNCIGCELGRRHCKEHSNNCHIYCSDFELAGYNLRIA